MPAGRRVANGPGLAAIRFMVSSGVKFTVTGVLFATMCTIPVSVYAGSGTARFNVGANVVRSGTSPAQQVTQTEPATTRTATPQLRYTCGAARISLVRNGFGSIRSLDCNGNSYRFMAVRSGRSYTVTFRAIGGHISHIRLLR